MGVKEFLEMTDKERFQVYLDLKGPKVGHLRAPFERAMKETKRLRPELLRLILEEWLENFEKHRGAAAPPAPPGDRKRGSRQ